MTESRPYAVWTCHGLRPDTYKPNVFYYYSALEFDGNWLRASDCVWLVPVKNPWVDCWRKV